MIEKNGSGKGTNLKVNDDVVLHELEVIIQATKAKVKKLHSTLSVCEHFNIPISKQSLSDIQCLARMCKI